MNTHDASSLGHRNSQWSALAIFGRQSGAIAQGGWVQVDTKLVDLYIYIYIRVYIYIHGGVPPKPRQHRNSHQGWAIFVVKFVSWNLGHASVIFFAQVSVQGMFGDSRPWRNVGVGEGVPPWIRRWFKEFHFGKIKRICKKSILTYYEVSNCPWWLQWVFLFIISWHLSRSYPIFYSTWHV